MLALEILLGQQQEQEQMQLVPQQLKEAKSLKE